MNILEHDSEGKYYHEYISRGSRSNEVDTIIISNRGTSCSTSFNGLHSEKDKHPEETYKRLINGSDIGRNRSDGSKRRRSSSAEPSESRMESGSSEVLIGSIKDEIEPSANFTCEHCSKTAYKDEEFETIKLGDLFTHVTQFPSTSDGTPEGPRLCAQCLNDGRHTGDLSSAHDNNIQHDNTSSVIDRNNLRSLSSSSYDNNNTVISRTSTAAETTNPESKGSAGEKSGTSQNNGERSAQLLQGVSTIIMQNSNLSQHHQLHLGQFQQQQQSNQQLIHSHNLQSPPPPPRQDMHHDHQQHFYQQGGQAMPQVKLETDLIAQQQSHNQQQHLDNFMLIHDSAMFPDNNESLQQQQQLHQTMVSFHQQQPDSHLHQSQQQQQQQRQQVICDNQQQQQEQPPPQHHQSAIQHIGVVNAPGSDTKYTIPTAIMQMQGKEQGGMDQGQGQQQHLIQFSGQNHVISLPPHSINGVGGDGGTPGCTTTTVTSSSAGGDVELPANLFLDMSDLETKPSVNPVATTMEASSVVTHTASTSSISSTTPSLMVTTSAAVNSKSSGSKARTNKSAKSGPGANSNKNSNAQQGENPKIPCDLCKKKFKNPKMAMNHYKRVHQKEARFVCEICGAVFSYRGSLDGHLASHKPEKTFDCGECGMKFSVKANLRQHMRIHSENPKKFPCDFCPSGFSKRVNLRYHIKRKHPEEAEKMNNNNNSKDNGGGGGVGSALSIGFPGAINSTSPNSTANSGDGGSDSSKDSKNQGNFKCEHCDRGFLFKNNLKAHLRTHTRDKKYTCELCGKSFIYKESLKNHMLLHSNELPYLCDICGKKFRDRSNRRKHVKNVHKYLFVNGDINNPLKPGASGAAAAAVAGSSGTSGAGQPTTSTTQPGEPPTKKRKNTKKAAVQPPPPTPLGEEVRPEASAGTSSSNAKSRGIIKSSGPKGKKAKNPNPGSSPPKGSAVSNVKSVIVSASTTASIETKLDRKIIMSPGPKTPSVAAAAGSGNVHSPNSMDYAHSSLPVTVHVPGAGNQGQFSHGRSIIVKAVSSASIVPSNHQSPPALSPEMFHTNPHHQQHQHHGRGPASMQQNVIVYPKAKVMPEHSQQYHGSSSVISQTMQQQHQYYVNPPPDPHHHQQQQGYSYLHLTSQQPSPATSSIMPPQSHISSPNPSAFEYVLGSTNLSSQSQQDNHRGGDPNVGVNSLHPYASGGGAGNGPGQQPMDIQVKSEYPYHLYASDPGPLSYDHQHPQQHYHWTSVPSSAPTGLDHVGAHPPNSSSPYQQLVAPPAGSNGSSSGGLVSEGPGSLSHPPVSLAQSYDSSGMNPTTNALNQAIYATGAPQGHEVLDPSGNGSNFYYKDFDFSYL